jgi:hypothetical protein
MQFSVAPLLLLSNSRNPGVVKIEETVGLNPLPGVLV